MSRQALRRASLVTMGAALAAAAIVRYSGGYDLDIAGLAIRGHRIDRMLWLAAIAFGVYLYAGGRVWHPTRGQIAAVWSAVAPAAARVLQPVAARPHATAVALALATCATGIHFGSVTVGGADSFGYMSQAYGWLSGQWSQPMPWTATVPWPAGPETFQPLGYRMAWNGTTLVPVYSPGLPLLFALFLAVGGACAAMLVVPLSGALAVYFTYRLGRIISTPWIGVAAAWMLATSPAFFFCLIQPMSDVPVAAAWVIAVVAALSGTPVGALAAGCASAWAVLIRINHGPFAAVLVLWLAAAARRRARTGGANAWTPVLAYLAGIAPGVAGAAAFNWYFHGSPLQSGYGGNEYLFRWEHVGPNLVNYASWITDNQTPLIWLGVAALVVPLGRWWSNPKGREVAPYLALFTALLWVQYLWYGVFDDWWYLRFLLGAFPFLFIGLGVAGRAIVRRLHPALRGVIIAAVLVGPIVPALARDRYAFDLGRSQSYFVTAARVAATATDPSSVIFAMQQSGSLRFYAGRMTLRYDNLDPRWLERAVAWLAERGAHPYALLEAWEVDDWRRRFGAFGSIGRLEMRPIRTFARPEGMVLYDLLATGPETPRVVRATPGDYECRPPAPAPSFSLAP